MLAARPIRSRCAGIAHGLGPSLRPFGTVVRRWTPQPTTSSHVAARFLSGETRRRPPREAHRRHPRDIRGFASMRVADTLTQRGKPRSRTVTVLCVLGAVAFYLYNSETMPLTGRRRFNFLSEELIAKLFAGQGGWQIQSIEQEGYTILPPSHRLHHTVQRVLDRLVPVCGSEHEDFTVYVVDDSAKAQPNAYVAADGTVFVYASLLSICSDEDGLAAVLGHELAHYTAGHTGERISLGLVANLTAGSIFFLAGPLSGLFLFGLWNILGGYYLRNYLFFLPMSRRQEVEADYVGLMTMAAACYDPHGSIGLWQRMHSCRVNAAARVPEMLNSHPSDEERVANMRKWMPEALQKREESACRGTAAYADRFRRAFHRGLSPGDART